MRYIYYEVHQVSHKEGESPNDKVIKNVNVLMNRPENLNSYGIYGFTHCTRSYRNRDSEEYLFVHQNWVDLEVYGKDGKDVFRESENIKKVLSLI